jgi:hypothetical protein
VSPMVALGYALFALTCFALGRTRTETAAQ